MAIFEKMLRGKELNAEEQRVLAQYREKRAQSTSTTAGGYTIPEGFAGRIVEYMKYISDLLNWANIIRTDTGNTIPFPINDDTSNTGELIGENADLSSSSADLVFSVYNLGAYKFSSKMIKVSAELLQDNGVNLTDYLARKLAERVARISNTYFTTGTGSSQPQGYLATSAASRGKVTASTSTFTAAEMVEFQDSIDPAYRNGRVAWAMHSNLLSEIKQLSIAATADHAVWVPSFRDGDPDRILGKPYFLNQAMSSTSATGDKIFAYGDWSKFNIRIVNDFSLRQLNERYAEYDQVAWFGLMRGDSFLENTAAIKYMDIS
jgi:HK97 family phage major capsid protein